MSKLEPRIEAIRKEYGLEATDFWQIKQNGQWVCKHAALEIVAVKAKITFDPPIVIEADAPNLVTSMVVVGRMGDRTEWATGETNPTNYSIKGKQPSYPWAMSEKRAKDRVILKLVGIHGLVYSEDEIAGEEPEPRTTDQRTFVGRRESEKQDNPKASSAAQKRGLEGIERELLDCKSIPAVMNCAKAWKHIFERDGWSQDFIDLARDKFNARKGVLKEAEAADVFPGDMPSPTGNPLTDNYMAG